MSGALEDLDVGALQDEIDRTALLGEIRSTISRLKVERPHVRNPGFWLSHVFQALYSVLARQDSVAPRAPAALDRLQTIPAFLDAARNTLDGPPGVFVDSALAMLGGGGELVVQIAMTLAGEAPDLREPLQAGAADGRERLKGY